MTRNLNARLERLEGRLSPPQGLVVIMRTIVWADGTVITNRCESTDRQHCWEQGPNESLDDFTRRVSDDAERITNHGRVALLPFNRRGL